jgi:hypothetical protein
VPQVKIQSTVRRTSKYLSTEKGKQVTSSCARYFKKRFREEVGVCEV